MAAGKKKINNKLRWERGLRGWSQKRLGFELDVSTEMISRWENGWKLPSPYYQSKLCELFGKTAEELGFLQPDHEMDIFEAGQRPLLSEANATHPPLEASLLLTAFTQPSPPLTLPRVAVQSASLEKTLLQDGDATCGLQFAQMIALVETWYGMAHFCHRLQDELHKKIKALETFTSESTFASSPLSRRSFLVALATLPAASMDTRLQAYTLPTNPEELLPQCAASITSCWHLSGGNHLESIPPILDSYLPLLVMVAHHTSSYREIAADLAAQCYFLKAILAWHIEGLESAEAYCIQAMHYSTLSKNVNLRLTALNQHALILYYARAFSQGLAKSEEAYTLLQQTAHGTVLPIVEGRVCMYLAALQAQQSKGFAQKTLEQAQKAFAQQRTLAQAIPLYADCGEASLTLWDGLTHYHLGSHHTAHAKQALASLRTFGQLQSHIETPERFRLECLNNRLLAAVQRQDMEEAFICFEAGREGAHQLASKQRSNEVQYAYQRMAKLWPKEKRIMQLGNQ